MQKKDFLLGLLDTFLTAVSVFLTIVLLDFRQILSGLHTDNLISWVNWGLKGLIIILIIIIFLFIYKFIIRKPSSSLLNRKYEAMDIVEYITRNRDNIKRIILFGYSLSFSEALRDYLSKTDFRNLRVDIVTPSQELINQRLVEEKSLAFRLAKQLGKIEEWYNLVKEKRIAELNVFFHSDIPDEYGVIINSNLIFMAYYKWINVSTKFKLEKMSLPERKLILLTHKHGVLFDYLWQKIGNKMLEHHKQDLGNLFSKT